MSFSKMVKSIRKNFKSARVLVLGHDNAGKSALLAKYLGLEGAVPPTLGYRIYSKSIGEYSLSLVDVGGQAAFQKYWDNYFESTDGIVYVIDSTSTRPVSQDIERISRLGVPMLIFLNKTDLASSVAAPQNSLENVHFVRSSALTGAGIQEGMEWLVSRLAADGV